ncbi:NUDIX hydrolase [Streptomyces sp. Da 82-17]|uniref:NUDIX hydrolase n=1 Tax=Streptomyces sp. Da 82-17 TaxID=3377116 RepID=UPI0038D422A1
MNSRVRTRISVYGIAADADRLLLARLSDASPVFPPGLWHLPGGGIDPGEQPVDALARELHEETGLTPATARLLDARTYNARRNEVSWSLTALFYAVTLRGCREPVVSEAGGSTEAAAWVPWSELRDEALLSPPTVDALGMLARAREALAD